MNTIKTAECVTPMHPDKICDRISDAILDACLEQDPMSRVAIETMGGHGIITITGELTTKAFVDCKEIVKKIVGDKYGVQVNIVKQSPIISQGVDTGGAGDQGIMVGYACRDNEAMIPQELYLARSLCQSIYEVFPYDGKTQITLNSDGNMDTIVASFQNVKKKKLHDLITDWLANEEILPEEWEASSAGIMIHANPGGDWELGGFEADTGVTGRKLAVDNYGPQIPIGGGAFSGKDATKVDRSGAYMARWIAVQLLKNSNPFIKEVIVKIAYAIGVAEPVMITATADGQEIDVDDFILECRPQEIIKKLELRKPQFEQTAQWGHFGGGFKWDL